MEHMMQVYVCTHFNFIPVANTPANAALCDTEDPD